MPVVYYLYTHECFSTFSCAPLHSYFWAGAMDITIAYFHPLHHAEVVKQDFDQIRAVGAGSIVYAIHEQEAQRWPRDLERGLRLAQDTGLKVYLSLGRYGNLFAGPAFMPSWYTFSHPHSRVMDSHGRYHDASCFITSLFVPGSSKKLSTTWLPIPSMVSSSMSRVGQI